MFKVDSFTSQTSQQLNLAFQHIFKQAYKKVQDWMSSEMAEDFEQRITKWAPHPNVLNKYPFFGDLSTFSADYCSCFLLAIDDRERTCSLLFDKEQAVKKGLPENITDILEYGDASGVPPILHLHQWSEELTRIVHNVFFQESM